MKLATSQHLLRLMANKISSGLSRTDICKNDDGADNFYKFLDMMAEVGWCKGSDLEKVQRLVVLADYYADNMFEVVRKQINSNRSAKIFLMFHTSFNVDTDDEFERAVALALIPDEEDFKILEKPRLPDEIAMIFANTEYEQVSYSIEPVRIAFRRKRWMPVEIIDTLWPNTKKKMSVREFIKQQGVKSMKGKNNHGN